MANAVDTVKAARLSNSEAFTNKVLKEFGGSISGAIQVTEYQKRLIQGYFIAIDAALQTAEENRVRRNAANRDHKYDNADPIGWGTVDLNSLALDVVHYARMGLDMTQDNHLYAIPFKNNSKTVTWQDGKTTKMYTVNLMPGYNGIQYIAEKYALDKPKSVTIELVYSTDVFKPIKKSRQNTVESYEFEITNAFDRGKVVGGFGYIEYGEPTKNKLIIMTVKDIEKRKPKSAAAEFWGGTVTQWDGGKKVEVQSDGWYEEMCLKTIKREVYSAKNMPRDPKKIDDAYQYMKLQEVRMAEAQAQDTIAAAPQSMIDIAEPPEAPDVPGQPSYLTEDTGQQALSFDDAEQADTQPKQPETAGRKPAF